MPRTAMRSLGALALLATCAQASVVGIDFGSSFMKVALVQLGVPLEIVTNTISKRKTDVAIMFDRGDRLFGSDVTGFLPRKPQLAYTKFSQMLGRSMDHPSVQSVGKQYYAMDMYQNETRGGISFSQGKAKEMNYSPEELTAMMLTHARDFTKDFGGKEIRDCVLTVPSFYTVHERQVRSHPGAYLGAQNLSPAPSPTVPVNTPPPLPPCKLGPRLGSRDCPDEGPLSD
mmetsp:Transcript_64308/g.178013  ORF Transcript_64308/g.178013 Transcript_64308/m.178013 type:complete len:229 (+) Transcript_64308:146-832(+)